MYKYEVGQTVDSFKHHSEGALIDIADDGATMLVFFQNPILEEIEQFKSGNNFEIRFTELYDVIMITVKIGDLNWMAVPYTPHLSKNLTKFQMPNENQGMGLTLILIDTVTGKIKHIRLLGLSDRFTRRLFGTILEHKMKAFNQSEYSNSVKKIFSGYSINKIIKLSKDYCKINA